MDLLLLAPEIQKEVLFLETRGHARRHPTEFNLRRVVHAITWEQQRLRWTGHPGRD